MRSCPACNTQYSDDTLSFCLQDGAPLLAPTETDTPTVVLGETETFVRGGVNVPVSDTFATSWQDSQVTHNASAAPASKGSKAMVIVLLAGLGLLVIIGVVGFAGFVFYQNSQQTAAVNNSNLSNVPKGSPATATPIPTVASNSAAVNAATPPQPVNNEGVTREVSSRINSWKSQAESLDLNSYMGHYAPTVDYYKKSGASAAFIRADKQRAFSKYSSIRVNISNLSVTTDASGQEATATMNKEWEFQGNGSSSGKVKQLIRFKKINGQWYITAEKDLKVYYTR